MGYSHYFLCADSGESAEPESGQTELKLKNGIPPKGSGKVPNCAAKDLDPICFRWGFPRLALVSFEHVGSLCKLRGL